MNALLSRCPVVDGKIGPAAQGDAHQSWIAAIAHHPTRKLLYAGDYSGVLSCWSVESAQHEIVWTQQAHHGWIRALAVSPDGRYVASAGNDKLVRLCSTSDPQDVRTLAGHQEHVYSLAFHPTGGRLVSGDLKGNVKEWNLETGEEVRQLVVKELFVQQQQLRLGGVRALAFDAQGAWLACGGMSGFGSIGDGIGSPTVILIDWASGAAKQTCLPKESARTFVMGAAFHSDGYVMAATGGLDRGYLLFWKIGQTEKEACFQFKLPESAWAMDFCPAKNWIVTAHHDKQLRLYGLQA